MGHLSYIYADDADKSYTYKFFHEFVGNLVWEPKTAFAAPFLKASIKNNISVDRWVKVPKTQLFMENTKAYAIVCHNFNKKLTVLSDIMGYRENNHVVITTNVILNFINHYILTTGKFSLKCFLTNIFILQTQATLRVINTRYPTAMSLSQGQSYHMRSNSLLNFNSG